MSTPFNWMAHVLDAAGTPVAGVAVAVQFFDLTANLWTTATSARTGADGKVAGHGEIPMDGLTVMPAMRLVQGEATVLAASPRVSASAGRRPISVDFGEVSQPRTQPAGNGDPILNAEIRKVVGVGEFATKLGREIDVAQSALKTRSFSLGQISVTARGVLQDGGRIELLDKDEMKALPADSLAHVNLNYRPDRPPPDTRQLPVPDVRQLTEGAARRVLSSLGLVLEASYGPPGLTPNTAGGQAMLQAPGAGEMAARGSRVLVIFARD